MAHHGESRRSEAANPVLSAEPEVLQPTIAPTVAPEAPPAGALALAPQPEPPARQEEEPQPDPAKYDWYPVLRRPRADGWTVDVQRRFIEILADTGSVDQACQEVGKSKSSAYALRRAPGAEGFAAAWRIAIDNAASRALDECFERALVGTDEPVFDRDGRRVGRRFRQSDKLLMFILRAYMPDRFRHAERDVRAALETPAPAIAPMRKAIAMVEPSRPVRPETTMDADDLDLRLRCADIMQGERPPWHVSTVEQDIASPSIDERFETELENAKRANAGLPPLEEDDDDNAR
jgi:hypothetical protein